MRNHGSAKSFLTQRQILTLLLLAAGICLAWPAHFHHAIEWSALVIALAFCLIEPLNRAAAIAAIRFHRFARKHRFAFAIILGLLVFSYLLIQIERNRDQMFLRIHDEHSYRIQSQMLARGMLWKSAYPREIFPFFDTFHVIVNRVYASIYFPGAAILMAPAIWLRLPYWIAPLACASAAAAIFFLIAAELFGPPRALLAALMLLSLKFFRWMAFMLMSETPFLLMAMVLIWAWLRWRRRRNLFWAMMIGAAAGWAMITRPLDAVCFSAAIGGAIAFELRRRPMKLIKTTLTIAAAAAPFLAVQIIQNVGVTGDWLQSPMQYYIRQNYPAPPMGFVQADLKNLPSSLSIPKRAFAASWMNLYREHTLGHVLKTWYHVRFPQLKTDTLPTAAIAVLLPLALAAGWDIRRVTIVAIVALDLVAYLDYIFPFDQYLVAVMPPMICIVLMGWEALQRAWPARQRQIAALISPILIACAISAIPGFTRAAAQMPDFCQPAKQIDDDLASLHTPSVVLFPFDNSPSALDWYPVFNDNAAWPDDAQIVRANDLGNPQNATLFDYYARIQPWRKFFRYDPQANDSHHLKFLGTATNLAANHASR